ncbi:hypothetical protein [Streptomyces sp. NPDC126514]|uniref:hypothetical protein n=1 Tax=Streptomyces sp. NPDC126514 TaxID=3155210 RepID=UPI00331EC4E7
MLKSSHHSLTQYTHPSTGELIPLLQIAASKTDEERLLVVSPELADVLSTIVSRVRGASGAIPFIPFCDGLEKIWHPPTPLLFQCLAVASCGLSPPRPSGRHSMRSFKPLALPTPPGSL